MYTALNERLFWLINGAHAPLIDPLMYLVSFSAYSTSAAIIALCAFWGYGGLGRRNVALLAAAMLLGGGALHAVKQNVDSNRPLAYFAERTPPLNAAVHAPYEQLYHGTFPSGHTQTAFSVAVLMALLFRRHRAWWFSWAALAGISRIYLGSHFPLDVLAGACIGAAVSAGTYYGFMAKGWVSPPQRRSAFFLWE